MKEPEGVRTKLSFDEGIADISRSHLLELMLMLRSYKEGLVVVGGWVPYFLLQKFQKKDISFQHEGSIDIDIAVNPKIIDEIQYAKLTDLLQARGYEPNQKLEFSYIKRVKTELGEREIVVDFLAPFAGGTSKSHRNQRVQSDFLARKIKGADLAFTNRLEFTLEGVLPNKTEAFATFYIADIVAILAMKGYVLGQRLKEKDAYDIFSLIMYYKNGVESVAEEIKPFMAHELVEESLSNLQEHFKSRNAVGPGLVADFFNDTGEERERRMTQAYLQVQRFLVAFYEPPKPSGKPAASALGNIPVLDIEPSLGGSGGSSGHFVHFQAINTGEKVAIDCHWGIRGFAYEWRSPDVFVLSPGEKKKLEYKFDGEKPFQHIVPELNIFFEYKDNRGISYFTRRELVSEKVPSGAFYNITKVGAFHPAVVLQDSKIRNISEPYTPQGNFTKEVVVDVDVDGGIKKVKIGIGLLNNIFNFSAEELKSAFAELVMRKVDQMLKDNKLQDFVFSPEELQAPLKGFDAYKAIRDSL